MQLVADRGCSGVSRSRFLIVAFDRVCLFWLLLLVINYFAGRKFFSSLFWVFAMFTEVYHIFNILEGFSCDWRLC